MKSFLSTFRLTLGILCLLVYGQGYSQNEPATPSTPLVVVKSATGKGLDFNPQERSRFLEPFQKMPAGHRLELPEKSQATLRLFLAQGQLQVFGGTQLKISQIKYQEKIRPALLLRAGTLDLNFSPEAGLLYLIRTQNTTLEPMGARWLTRFDSKNVTKVVVVKGTVKAYNHPKDMAANIPEGKTCYSDQNGLRIVTSTQEDLEEIRQNILEVDFKDPVTDQIKSLEIEYEANF